MSDSLKPTIALVTGPRSCSKSIIDYFVKHHDYSFEHNRILSNKPNTIYLFRIPATYNRHGTKKHTEEEKEIEKFIETAKSLNTKTISLIRSPLSQLLSTYHKTIDNRYNFDQINFNQDTTFDTFLQYRDHNSIIHESLQNADIILDIEKASSQEIEKTLKTKFINRTENSSNRGVEFWLKHFKSKHTDKVENSQSQKIYSCINSFTNQKSL